MIPRQTACMRTSHTTPHVRPSLFTSRRQPLGATHGKSNSEAILASSTHVGSRSLIHIFHVCARGSTLMDRPNKLQRLEQFRRRVPHVSASALSKILAEVEASGVPELHSRDDMRDARHSMATRLTPYGAVLQDMQLVPKAPHGPIRLLYLHPLAMLYTAFAHADGFSQFFKSRLAEHPPSPRVPWSLILYSDEITPGNVLAPTTAERFRQSI